jgi:dTDP-4-amino-4,6-dideoxygalactose transaminase
VRSQVERIEEFFRRRYGMEAMYLPSGRLGLYVAFREWLSPGDRVLMSPVTDDVVFFTVLAAGLVPVLGPIDPRTGNLDPKAIDDATWSRVRALLTTNLYGIPDQMDVLAERCRKHGVLLLEDACHAFDSRFDGKRIGTFGAAAVHSFAKHLEVPGGMLLFADPDRRDSLARRAHQEIRDRPYPKMSAYRWLSVLLTVVGTRQAPKWLKPLVVRAKVAPADRWQGHRMRFTMDQVRLAQEKGGGLNRFNRWVRMDHLAYRSPPSRVLLGTSLHRLETFEEDRRARIDAMRQLLDLGFTPAEIRIPPDTALFRVPLFVEDRERVIDHLFSRGLSTECIYDPPLDLYAPELSEHLPSPPSARIWSRDVLPVNPRRAGRFLALLREAPGLFKPLGGELGASTSHPPAVAAGQPS